MNMIRLVLADDEKWVLRIIKDALSEMRTELCIVGEASNGLEALELCKNTARRFAYGYPYARVRRHGAD